MKKRVLFGGLLLAAASFHAGAERDIKELRRAVQAKMPGTLVSEIRPAPIAGWYEGVANGINVFYFSEDAELALFGNLVKLDTSENLTEQRLQELRKVDFAQLPLEKAIVKVKGNGERKLAVFSDPDCPYCRDLERELGALDNVTIYIFLYPLEELHPDAPRKAQAVWCAPNRAQAWDDLMLAGREPGDAQEDCAAPLDDIAQLARKLWITGTPGLVFGNGKLVPGMLPAAGINALLDASGS